MINASVRYSAEVLGKARRLVRERRVWRDEEFELVWWVRGGNPTRDYRVQLGEADGRLAYITCTCTHGIRAGAGDCRCYHSAAVLMVIQDEQDRKEAEEAHGSADVVDLNLRRMRDIDR
jgi:uncharacterized Zn finger protein